MCLVVAATSGIKSNVRTLRLPAKFHIGISVPRASIIILECKNVSTGTLMRSFYASRLYTRISFVVNQCTFIQVCKRICRFYHEYAS